MEEILEPHLPIVDAHHHLWLLTDPLLNGMAAMDSLWMKRQLPLYRSKPRYLFDEFLADVDCGHNLRASVFVEAHTMYRATGPQEFRSVGEVEFANGVAAMSASGLFGEFRACAALIGGVDLTLGPLVADVLEAHIAAGNGRYRGVRSFIAHDDDTSIMGPVSIGVRGLGDPAFRAGFELLEPLGLLFEAWLLEPQLPDLLDLARSFPGTTIVLNHVGTPIAIGQYDGQREARFPIWRENMAALAGCPNVVVKLGGFGTALPAFPSYLARPPFPSAALAEEWRPYIETCIALFGVDRCMFGSNFPVDIGAGSYRTLWNAFKRVAVSASPDEKAALFAGTACRTYRIVI